MSDNFKREARYVVLKNADIMQCLTVNELIELRRIQAKAAAHRAKLGKPWLDCVVVESDWPEYEPTWRAIEARVTGAPCESAVQVAARIMNHELIKECDELRAKIAEMERQAPVTLDHIACVDNGVLRFMTGRKAPAHDCELYAMPNGKAAPKLYTLPGAQNVPAVPAKSLKPVIDWLRNGCDPMKAADELEILIAAALKESK